MSDAPYAIEILKIADAMQGERSRGHVEPMDLPRPASRSSGDMKLMAALRKGDGAATAKFIKSISGMVWTVCALFAGEGEDGRTAFSDILEKLSTDRFARLAGYDGRGSLNTFVMLIVREILSERVLRLLAVERDRSWDAFERLFKSDIQRLIHRRIPAPQDEELRQDLYQDICIALIEDDYHRLKSYKGSGSFGGFVLQTADRLLIDLIRKFVPRRRLPAAIAASPPLDQLIFKLIFWKSIPASPETLAPYARAALKQNTDFSTIAAALERVRPHAPGDAPRPTFVSLPSGEDDCLTDTNARSPEDNLMHAETEETLGAALSALQGAIADLPSRERHYLSIALNGAATPPAREIARLMQCPVEEIYRLKQNILKRLRVAITDDAAVKSWRASV
jgi:RNA polymerase primary sigma factor